jgi:hypothetical protein
MKILVLFAVPCIAFAATWSKGSQLVAGSVSSESLAACVKHAGEFITKPMLKGACIEKAMDHCALDKKVDDKNFVCPHYEQILTDAFRRESTKQMYTAKSFCEVAETYVSQLNDASKVPNMGKGAGFNFELSKDCKPLVSSSFGGKKTLPAKTLPDFWYALCMNQDCAHFLPSRTRWCTKDHAPTHSASVCEAVRVYARDEVFVMEQNLGHDLSADEVCKIYDDFVEDTHINVKAYNHVVYGTKDHPVPSPENNKRALDSAQMKNEAKGHEIRDAVGQPVKSAAAKGNLILSLVSLLGLWTSTA